MKNESFESVSALCSPGPWPRGSLFLGLYFPVGLLLLVSRIAMLLLFYGLSPVVPKFLKKTLYRVQVFSLGIKIRCKWTEEEIRMHTQGCVVAANHVSAMDAFFALALPNATIMVGNPISSLNLFGRICYASAFDFSGAKFWFISERRALVKHLKSWRDNPAGTTLYTTPEMTINNQRGIFKFNTAFVCLDMPVVPLAITVRNCFDMQLQPVKSSNFMIFVRILMLPGIVFNLDYLGKTARFAGESKECFAKRIQTSIANHLGVPATEWTAADKHAYRKAIA